MFCRNKHQNAKRSHGSKIAIAPCVTDPRQGEEEEEEESGVVVITSPASSSTSMPRPTFTLPPQKPPSRCKPHMTNLCSKISRQLHRRSRNKHAFIPIFSNTEPPLKNSTADAAKPREDRHRPTGRQLNWRRAMRDWKRTGESDAQCD